MHSIVLHRARATVDRRFGRRRIHLVHAIAIRVQPSRAFPVDDERAIECVRLALLATCGLDKRDKIVARFDGMVGVGDFERCDDGCVHARPILNVKHGHFTLRVDLARLSTLLLTRIPRNDA
jgi:hypothetical protein